MKKDETAMGRARGSLRRRILVGSAVLFGGALACLAVLAGCIAFPPRPGSVPRTDRMASFPTRDLRLRGRAEVCWSDRQIPFVFAAHDDDVPYVLGLVHAHLRRGQMELFRLVSQGRLSELAGPFTRDLDASIRCLDLSRAVPEIERRLPPDTRRWLERYVAGINDHDARSRRPYELRALGFHPEPWTVRDVLCLGRLLSIDITWLRWYHLLALRDEPAFPAFLQRLSAFAGKAVPSFGGAEPTPVESLFEKVKSGSNSIVIAPWRSASGGALIASDPHLGLQQPNFWILVGYRSPAGSAVGMMYPGIPFVLIGRNESIAWGGTNMQGLSSTLFDVSKFPESAFRPRREAIAVRFWPDREMVARDTDLGPVITDAPLLADLGARPLALRWRGHRPSDEATAMMRVNRARDWPSFRRAFETYAVSGQNLLYADTAGNIGQLLGIEFVPAAGRTARILGADPEDPRLRWGRGLRSTELPAAFNPSEGFLVSCNNTPVKLDPSVTLLGNANDRVERLRSSLTDRTGLTVRDLMSLQRDVFSAASLGACRVLVAHADGLSLRDTLAGWDGCYAVDSRGAAAYQQVLHRLLAGPYASRLGEKIADYLRDSVALHDFVREDIESGVISRAEVRSAIQSAADGLGATTTWGERHRLRIAHPFAAVPVLGARYDYDDVPVPGTTTTVWKSAHGVTPGSHAVTFGQNARHVSDLSDPDANYFVILGGQDGWLGSENQLDQVALWREGRYLQVPLREATVRATFGHRSVLTGRATPGPE